MIYLNLLRKSILTIFCGLLLFPGTYGQTYENCIGFMDDDKITSVAVTSDGGMIVGGTVMDSLTLLNDIMLMRISPEGEPVWAKRYGYSNDDTPVEIKITQDGGFLVAENSTGTCYLSKWNLNGDKLWSVNLYTQKIIDFTLMGDTGYGYCSSDGTIAAIDTSGVRRWVRYINGPYLNSITSNNIGGLTSCGSKSFTPYPGTAAYIVSTFKSGTIKWQKSLGEEEHTEYAYDIKQTSDLDYVLAGSHCSKYVYPAVRDAILRRTNSSGEPEMTKYFGGSEDDFFESVDTVPGGGYIMCGSTSSTGNGMWDLWLVRTNVNGDTLWTKTFGGSYEDYGVFVKSLPDGFIVAGYTNSFWNNGFDFYLIRTDTEGNVQRNSGIGIPARKKVVPESIIIKNRGL